MEWYNHKTLPPMKNRKEYDENGVKTMNDKIHVIEFASEPLLIYCPDLESDLGPDNKYAVGRFVKKIETDTTTGKESTSFYYDTETMTYPANDTIEWSYINRN